MCKRGDSTQCSDDMLHDPAGKGVLCSTFPDFVRTSRGSPRRCCVSGGRSRACVIVSGSSSSARKRADTYARVYVRFGNGLHQSSNSKLSRITAPFTGPRRTMMNTESARPAAPVQRIVMLGFGSGIHWNLVPVGFNTNDPIDCFAAFSNDTLVER